MKYARRLFELAVVVSILVGVVLVWRTHGERAKLRAEYERLTRKSGDLQITDPAKVHILALETGDPMRFAWRVYLPPNYSGAFHDSESTPSMGTRSRSSDFVLHVRLHENNPIEVLTRMEQNARHRTLGGSALFDLMRGRWGELKVEQLGVGKTAVVEVNDAPNLLRLTMSKELENDAQRVLTRGYERRLIPVIYEVDLLSNKEYSKRYRKSPSSEDSK